MNDILNTLRLLAEILMYTASGVAQRVSGHSEACWRSLRNTALWILPGILILALIKMLTGWVLFSYMSIGLAVITTIILAVMWGPLAIFLGLILPGTTARQTSISYLRGVGLILFFELMLSAIILEIPFHQSRGMIPIFLILTSMTALGGVLFGGGLSEKYYTKMALIGTIAVIFICILPSIRTSFIPQTIERLDNKIKNVYAAPTPELNVPQPAQAQAGQAENWKLSWEKKPEQKGKTPTKTVSVSAIIKQKDNLLVAEYDDRTGGKGSIIATLQSDGSYDGKWSDRYGSGNIHLRFSSKISAFGWADDGPGTEKAPTSLSM